MSKRPAPVKNSYMGQSLPTSQATYNGRGGGSKATPQANLPGSGKLGSSAPKNPQKLRG